MFVFAENLACFVFVETPVLRFALLSYYRRNFTLKIDYYLKCNLEKSKESLLLSQSERLCGKILVSREGVSYTLSRFLLNR